MIYGKLNSLAPFATQESWDNSGLLVGDPGAEVKTALVVLDITAEAVREAREIGAELIISHHPVIFRPLKKVESGSVVWELAQAGISAICAHTNLDKARGGVNDCLAAALGLEHVTNYAVEGREKHYKLAVFVPVSHAEAVRHAMIGAGAGTIGGYTGCTFSVEGTGRFVPGEGTNPWLGQPGQEEAAAEVRLETVVPAGKLDAVLTAMRQAHPYEVPAFDVVESVREGQEIAIGRIGELPEPLSPQEFARLCADRLNAGVRWNRKGRTIRKVAVLGGAGGDYLQSAAAAGADALVTGEAKHHEYLEAVRMGITLLDATHYATEQVVLRPLAEYLDRLLSGCPLCGGLRRRRALLYRWLPWLICAWQEPWPAPLWECCSACWAGDFSSPGRRLPCL